MKTNFIVLFILMNLAVIPVYGIQMRYANTTLNGKTLIDKAYAGELVKIDDENPETLRILGVDCILDAPFCTVMTAPDSWEEKYLIKKTTSISKRAGFSQVRDIGIVTLYKNKKQGVIGIAFSDRPDCRHLFRPGKGQYLDVTSMPDVFINQVQMANVRADGNLISDYNSVMERTDIDCLKISAAYQKSSNDKNVEFLFQIATKNGDIIRSIKASEGNALVPSCVDDKYNFQVCIQFNKKELKQMEKGNRLEIYAEGNRLCSVDIPIRGTIVYKPTLVVRVRTSENEIHCVPFNPRNNSLYGEPSLTKQHLFMSGKHQYKVLDWQEIEL